MDVKVYVIYKDGELYSKRGKKSIYLREKSAKQIITVESKIDAENLFEKDLDENIKKNVYIKFEFYKLSKYEQDKYVKEAKKRYEIRIFTDSGEVLKEEN